MLDVEMRIDIAMAFQNIHDLKYIVSVLKEDNVCPLCHASHIRPQFGSSTSQSS